MQQSLVSELGSRRLARDWKKQTGCRINGRTRGDLPDWGPRPRYEDEAHQRWLFRLFVCYGDVVSRRRRKTQMAVDVSRRATQFNVDEGNRTRQTLASERIDD